MVTINVDPKKLEALVTKELKKYVEPKYMPKVKEKVLKMVNKDIKIHFKQECVDYMENIDVLVSDYVQEEFTLDEIQEVEDDYYED